MQFGNNDDVECVSQTSLARAGLDIVTFVTDSFSDRRRAMIKDVGLAAFVVVVCLVPSVVSYGITIGSSSLGKKSTALNVLRELNRSDRLANYVSQQGTAVVTGGNSGIGAVTVETLALSGMRVVLCARNPESAQSSVVDKLSPSLRPLVEIQPLDLADLTLVEQAAADIVASLLKGPEKKNKKISVLINNAGLLASSSGKQMTAQNLELMFGVNHVGHHLWTRLLLPHMATNGRVVTVASEAHRFATTSSSSNLSWERSDYVGFRDYGQSKLANVLFATRLQELCLQQGRSDVSSVSLHPGVVGTNLWRDTPAISGINRLVKPLLDAAFFDKTTQQGAATTVYCALAQRVEGGAYYQDCRVASASPTAEDCATRMDLWDYTEQLLESKGFLLPATLFSTTAESMTTTDEEEASAVAE